MSELASESSNTGRGQLGRAERSLRSEHDAVAAQRTTYAELAGEVVKGAIRNPWNPRAAYVYEESTGTVLVTMGARWGRFTTIGEHVEGPLFEADPELCIWMSRPRPKNHHRTSRVVEMSGEH